MLQSTSAQKYITKSGTIEILSETTLFPIKGVNHKVASILNTESGEIIISLLIRSFEFEETFIEEYFNDKCMESSIFPNSIFKGRIINFENLDFTSDGTYSAIIEGKLTIHGIAHEIHTKAEFTIADAIIFGKTEFSVSLAEYEVEIGRVYKNSVKENILLKVDFQYTHIKMI